MNERLGALLYISSGYKSRPPLKVVGEVAQIYGLDWGPEGIGANFLIDVNWDPAEGESFPWKNYLNYWDHKFFNDLPEFSTGPITLERICLKIFEYLQNKTQLKS